MGILKKHWLTAALLIAVMFIVTACFQQVGDEGQGPAISLVVSDTPLPEASDTPTEETVIEATAADVGISINSSDTPTPTNTNSPTPTDSPTETPTPMSVAQVGDEGQLIETATPDEFELQATQLIIDATNTAVAPTTQAAATLFGQTDTPTPTSLAPIATVDLGSGGGAFISGVDCVHEVRTGETLFRLSLFYGIPVNTIATANGIVNPNVISIGQRLTISGCGTTGAIPPPTSTPTPTVTPFQLQTNLGQGGADLGQGGGATTGTTTTGAVGGSCVQQYSVQQYDTLFRISVQFGVPVQSIANANGIVDPNRIDMFEVLCIPAS